MIVLCTFAFSFLIFRRSIIRFVVTDDHSSAEYLYITQILSVGENCSAAGSREKRELPNTFVKPRSNQLILMAVRSNKERSTNH